jgi:flagellar hook assembly protein FlgD
VAPAGDVNGDEVDDIIASSDNYWTDTNHRGEVFIFAGDSLITVGVEFDYSEETNKPSDFALRQNYPNPFNSTTVIGYSLRFTKPTHITLKIYNLLGEEVRTLVEKWQSKGDYQVKWNGRDDLGREVASGIYFYRLKSEDFTDTKRMMLIK